MKVAERIRSTTKAFSFNRVDTAFNNSISVKMYTYDALFVMTCIFIDGSRLIIRHYLEDE